MSESAMIPESLPPFPVDDQTLSVLRDSLDRVITGVDDSGNWTVEGSAFSVDDVLNLLSGYDSSRSVPLIDEDGYSVPGWWCYPGRVYTLHDALRALIDEVRRLRGEGDA